MIDDDAWMQQLTGGVVARPGFIPLASLPFELASWEEESARWFDYVMEIQEISCWEGRDHNGTNRTAPGLMVEVKSKGVRLAFWYERIKGHLQVELHDAEALSSEEVESWKWVVNEAVDRLQNEVSSRWYAWLTAGTTTFGFEEKRKLDLSGQIGEIDLQPLGSPSFEEVRGLPSSGAGSVVLWPIGVSGVSKVDGRGEFRATHQIERIRLVVTLASAQPWYLRGAVKGKEHKYDPGAGIQRDNFLNGNDDSVPRGEFSIDPWMVNTYDLMEKDAQFQSAVRMYAEGLAVIERHKSLAALCFTAIVETVAERRQGAPDTCAECNSKTGATRRFRAALKSVVDEKEAGALSDIYGKRSTTVHRSELHGSELLLGIPFEHRPRTQMYFDHQVWRLGSAARALLIEEAGGMPGGHGQDAQ